MRENSAPRPAACVPSSEVERAPQGSGLPCSAHPALPRPGAVLGHHPSLDTWPMIQQHNCPKKWASAGLDPWPALPLVTVTPLFAKATASCCSLTPPHGSSNPPRSPHSATLAPLFLTDLRCSPRDSNLSHVSYGCLFFYQSGLSPKGPTSEQLS